MLMEDNKDAFKFVSDWEKIKILQDIGNIQFLIISYLNLKKV